MQARAIILADHSGITTAEIHSADFPYLATVAECPLSLTVYDC